MAKNLKTNLVFGGAQQALITIFRQSAHKVQKFVLKKSFDSCKKAKKQFSRYRKCLNSKTFSVPECLGHLVGPTTPELCKDRYILLVFNISNCNCNLLLTFPLSSLSASKILAVFEYVFSCNSCLQKIKFHNSKYVKRFFEDVLFGDQNIISKKRRKACGQVA